MNEITVTNQTLTISSLEIAERTGKTHKNVLVDIRKMLSDLELTTAEFSAVYMNEQNKQQPMFNLPKREALILATGYSTKLRASLIDRIEELETKIRTIEAQAAKLDTMLTQPPAFPSTATPFLTSAIYQELKVLARKDAQWELRSLAGRKLRSFMTNLLIEDSRDDGEIESPAQVDMAVMNMIFYIENALKFLEIDAKSNGKSLTPLLDGHRYVQPQLPERSRTL